MRARRGEVSRGFSNGLGYFAPSLYCGKKKVTFLVFSNERNFFRFAWRNRANSPRFSRQDYGVTIVEVFARQHSG